MRKLQIGLSVVVVVMCLRGGALWAQSAADRVPWKAEWVTMAGVPQRDEVVLHFRKVIEVGAVPAHFVVDMSADNAFVFYVNGKRVGTGPAKNDLGHWKYEVYDLTPFLHAGKNVLAATVWNFGTRSAVAQMSDRVGLLVHGESEAERAADTDATWDVELEKGLTTLEPELPGFYYAAGPGERVDAGKFDWSFASDEVKDKSAWTKAVTLGRGALRGERDAPNNWQLVKDPLPAMEMREVASGQVVRATGIALTIPTARLTPGPGLQEVSRQAPGVDLHDLVIPQNTKISLLLDQRELVTGYPELMASGGAGSNVRMTYAEALFDAEGKKGNRNEIKGKHILGVADEFVVGEAEKDAGTPRAQAGVPVPRGFMPLGWRTWRYLQVDVETGEQPLRIEELKTWFSAYPFEEKGYFRAEGWQKIWDIGWRTARLDAHDTYMDTPYWERLQYIGDTRIQAMVSYTVAGDDRLARQAIVAFNHSRIPDGLTQSRYPSQLVQMIPTFSLMWVGMVHDFWMYRGDADFVKANLPGVRTVMDWYVARQRADGLLGKIPWWPFVDWGKDFVDGVPPQETDGGSSVITLQFVEALRYAGELEETYGDKHQAELYKAAAEKASAGIWKLCWNEQWGLLADTPAQKHFSQHANILGVWLDVIPQDRQADVIGRILTRSERDFASTRPVPEMTLATYYFRYYLARAVEHSGTSYWYSQLLRPWWEMMDLGLTTWAEQPEPTRSDSHAWSSSPNIDLVRIVAGIRPASPGFATVRIEPHLMNMPRVVEAGIPTPKGMVEVKYTTVASGVDAAVRLPEGVTGELVWEGKVTAVHAGEQKVEMRK
jgi:alpha-L-rhamnosidase